MSLINELNKRGLPFSLISGTEGPLISDAKKLSSIFLLDSFKRELGLRSIWGELKTFFSIMQIIKKLKKEAPTLIVHTHSTKAGLLGRWAAFFAGIKTRVHTVHGFGHNPHQFFLKWLSIYLLELITSLITTHYICVSQKDRNEGIRLFPQFAKKSSIIRAAVNWDKFFIPENKDKELDLKQKSPNKKTPFIIGTVSCFKPQKNLIDMLKAFKHVYAHNKNIELHIIGDGYLRTTLECWINKNNLNQSVKLLGWQENVAPIMRSWDIFVMSSLWEGLPCAVIEARLSKLPVIAYNVGGTNEVIFDNKNGFLIKPKHWLNLAEKILCVINDKKLLLQLKHFQDDLIDFNHEVMATHHYKLYHALSNNQQKKSCLQ